MRADAERNNARILEAARQLVRARGADVAMDEIAAAAGVAVGTLYRHHPTKAALLEAVVADGLDGWAERAEAAAGEVAAGADPATVLAGFVRTMAGVHAADRTIKSAAAALGAPVSALTGPLPTDGVELRILTAVEAVLASARDAGAVRPDFAATDLALLISGVPDGEEQAGRYADLVLGGILAGAPVTPR